MIKAIGKINPIGDKRQKEKATAPTVTNSHVEPTFANILNNLMIPRRQVQIK